MLYIKIIDFILSFFYRKLQADTFGSPEAVIAFCQGIQAAAPVDSHVTPEPWDMPGYDSQVIMAAGAFVSGSSIELSADAPIKPPNPTNTSISSTQFTFFKLFPLPSFVRQGRFYRFFCGPNMRFSQFAPPAMSYAGSLVRGDSGRKGEQA